MDDAKDLGLLIRCWCRLYQSRQLDLFELLLLLLSVLARLQTPLVDLRHPDDVGHADLLEAKGLTLVVA